MDNLKQKVEKLKKTVLPAKLMVVTKKRSPKEIREAIATGVKHIGENTVQEIQKKYDLNLFRELQKNGVQLHYIGALQRNKVNKIVKLCDVIQSVDSIELAEKVNQAAAVLNKVMPIYIQLNLTGEEQKHGISLPEGEDRYLRMQRGENIDSRLHRRDQDSRLPEILEKVKNLPNLHLLGFMTLGKQGDPEMTRQAFRRCRQLADTFGLKEVSMGMSEDYPIAIQEGATMVRIGSLVFESEV